MARNAVTAFKQGLSKHSAVCMAREVSPGTWRLQHASQQQDDIIVTLDAGLVSEDVWTLGPATMSALLPHRQGMLPSVRAFLDHLTEEVPKIMVV